MYCWFRRNARWCCRADLRRCTTGTNRSCVRRRVSTPPVELPHSSAVHRSVVIRLLVYGLGTKWNGNVLHDSWKPLETVIIEDMRCSLSVDYASKGQFANNAL